MRLAHAVLQLQHVFVLADDIPRPDRKIAQVERGQVGRPVDRERQGAQPQCSLDQRYSAHRPGGAAREEARSLVLQPHRQEHQPWQHGGRRNRPFGAERKAEEQAAGGQPHARRRRAGGTRRACELPQADHAEAGHRHVEHRDTAMDEPQEVGRRQQHRGQRRKPAQACQPHQPAKGEQANRPHQRRGNPPAERSVAQQPDRAGQQCLAQHRVFGIGPAKLQQLARGLHIMHLVEIDSRGDAQIVPAQRQERERKDGAPPQRVAVGCGRLRQRVWHRSAA